MRVLVILPIVPGANVSDVCLVLIQLFRRSKIANFCMTVFDIYEDVARLQITMRNVPPMQELQTPQDLVENHLKVGSSSKGTIAKAV